MYLTQALVYTSLIGVILAVPSPYPTPTAAPAPLFTYNATHFLLNDEPYQIIGGQMDPQRIPPIYWRDRLKKARAMGLNTIFPYVFWNMLEPVQGTWVNKDENDIASFFRIAQEEGLNIVLRPGPYICGEREWGGFPAWLAEIPDMIVRANNKPFLDAANSYIKRLAEDLAPLEISRGGPILMIQVENEYGSFGQDHNYTTAIRDMLRVNFASVLYTNDGGVDWTLAGGAVPGVLAEVDGDPSSGFRSLRQYVNESSERGPLLDGEYYTWAPDQWGAYNSHNTTNGQPAVVEQFVKDLDYVLGNQSSSISLYMVHGGTNFGFSNGALWQNRTTAFTTSYDYGSPIDESGRTTDLYVTLRETIQKYVPSDSIPAAPANLARATIPELALTPYTQLFIDLPPAITSKWPLTMEALGQAYGFTLYEHTATFAISGPLQPGDRARDRILVYVDDVCQGVIDSQYQHPPAINVNLRSGSKLQLLAENLGRVDYYSRGNPYRNYLQDPYKGVLGNVSVNGSVLETWDMFPLQLDSIPHSNRSSLKSNNSSGPLFYRGTFTTDEPATAEPANLDTFLAIPAGVKGNVWVNGFHLGRYWRVGPQQSLYLPGTLIKTDGQLNEIVVLELEPEKIKGDITAVGQSERVWGNNPDPDCPRCV